MPRISVVVPCYNAEKYIGETLDSIAAQNFPDFDVHIVDDCSTDGSPAIVKAICGRDPRFHYHRSQSNFGGPAGPRNLGIAASQSEFVAFCDADDIWVPYKLKIQLDVAEKTGAAVVSSEIRDFNDGAPLPDFPEPSSAVPTSTLRHGRLLVKNWIAMSSVLIRRTTLEAAGSFNEATSYIAVEDFDMWLRITATGTPVVRVGVPMVHYRKLANSISAKKWAHVEKALNMIGEDYRRRGHAALFRVIRPAHWLLYAGTSAWTRAIRGTL